jgi:alkylhydroperoxidase family enzyme
VTSRASRSPFDELRAIAAGTAPAPETIAAYLAKVRDGAYQVTDEDVERLKAAGCSENEIFEQTVAVAIREGLSRLDTALLVIG